MLKGKGENERGEPVYLFGLSRENTKRLHKGKPILIELAEFGGVGQVIILAGETEETLAQQIRTLYPMAKERTEG